MQRVSLNEREVQVRTSCYLSPFYAASAQGRVSRLVLGGIYEPGRRGENEILTWDSWLTRSVQIWFQNRRQNDRRKSRPLSPHELSQLKFAKSGVPMISDPRELQDMSDERHPVSDPAPISSAMLSSSPYARPSTSLQGLSDNARPTSLRGHVRSFSDASSRVDGSKKGDSVLEAQTLGPISSSHSFSGTVGWLANRRNLGNSVTAPFFRTPKKDESSG